MIKIQADEEGNAKMATVEVVTAQTGRAPLLASIQYVLGKLARRMAEAPDGPAKLVTDVRTNIGRGIVEIDACLPEGKAAEEVAADIRALLHPRGVSAAAMAPVHPKAKTYRDLRDLLATLPDEHLDRVITWTGEEKGGCVYGFWQTEEDWHGGDEGLERYADVIEYQMSEDMQTEEEARKDIGPPDFPKGSLLLEVDPS